MQKRRGIFLVTLSLPLPEEPEQEGQEQAQQNACGQREIEREILLLDHYVSRKPPYKWNFAREEQHTTNQDHGDAKNNEELPYVLDTDCHNMLFLSKKYAGCRLGDPPGRKACGYSFSLPAAYYLLPTFFAFFTYRSISE